jgi:hypothetical protein
MNKKRLFFTVSAVFIVLLMTGCKVVVSDHEYDDRGTIIIKNNTDKCFNGTVWADSRQLFNGTIHAWKSKSFHVHDNCYVHADFESDDGCRSRPSGYVKRDRTLVLEL